MNRKKKKVFIIAEAGVNHNGCIDTARKLVDEAVWSGADAVKFQSFIAEKVVSKFAPKATYQKMTTDIDESQLSMIRKLQLNSDAQIGLSNYCKERDIMFLSSPFDLESIDLLRKMGLKIFKIPSGEITNLPYLRKIGGLKKKIILSSGMASLAEIKDALDVLIRAGTRKDKITVLHCNTEYPTPYEDVNLLAMLTIQKAFNVDVGYSDHTLGIEVPIAAAALGASIIEKHFTLDKNMEGPDHKTSLEPEDFKAMVSAIRNVELALGDGIKRTSSSELKNKPIARKSIVASKDICKGEILNENNLTTKRPGTGINPMKWDEMIGRTAGRDYGVDELIDP